MQDISLFKEISLKLLYAFQWKNEIVAFMSDHYLIIFLRFQGHNENLTSSFDRKFNNCLILNPD